MELLRIHNLIVFILAGTAAARAAEVQTGTAALPTIDQIVARHIQATGGQAAWNKLTTQTRKGIALPDSANLVLESFASASGKWAFVIHLPKGAAIRHGFDGNEGWEDRGTPARMEREAAFEEGFIYNPFWVLKLKDYFPRTSLKGIEKNGDSEVYVIEAAPTEGCPKILYFDVQTGLLTRAGKTVYADYRDAGGVKVPFLVRYGWQTMQFTEIRHGDPVEEARFRMPPAPPKPPETRLSEPLPAVNEVLDKYFQAIGGVEAFGRFKTRVAKGVLKEDGRPFPVETFAKAPGKWLLRIETVPGSADRDAWNGTAGWSEASDVIRVMDPGEKAVLESFLDLQLPLKLNRLRPNMVVKRKEKTGQQEAWVIEASLEQGRRETLCFDVQTGLLVGIDSVLFEDYRNVDGVKLPFTVKLYGGRFPITFSEIRHDAAIADALFDRPARGPAFEKSFAGLDDSRAVPVLRKAFGQGVSPSDGRMLYDLIVEKGYKRALDIGTARGYGSIWFGLAMKKNGGRVITIEIDPERADEARENFRQAGLAAVIDSRINDALLEIPAIKGDFDFVFIDTGTALNKKFFDLLHARISPGGAITAHNAREFQSHQPDFLKAIQTDPSLETKIVDTRSGGISISVKKK